MRARYPRSWIATALAVAALAAVWAGGWAVSASADDDIGVTWAIEPASAQRPDGRTSMRMQLAPGSRAQDHVVVSNLGAAPATFHVYASDGLVTDAGDFDVLPVDQSPEKSGSWIGFTPPPSARADDRGGFSVTVDAGERLVVPVTIAVPTDATPGDHPAGIVAEFVPERGAAVQVASRVGLRLHLRVTGEITPAVRVAEREAQWRPSLSPFSPGVVAVEVSAENLGNVRVGGAVTVRIGGLFGLVSDEGVLTHREILPGGEAVGVVEVPTWGLFLMSGTLDMPLSAVGDDIIDAPLRTATARFDVWAIPYPLLAALLLLVLAARLMIVARRRSAARVQARIDAAVAAATAVTAREPASTASTPNRAGTTQFS